MKEIHEEVNTLEVYLNEEPRKARHMQSKEQAIYSLYAINDVRTTRRHVCKNIIFLNSRRQHLLFVEPKVTLQSAKERIKDWSFLLPLKKKLCLSCLLGPSVVYFVSGISDVRPFAGGPTWEVCLPTAELFWLVLGSNAMPPPPPATIRRSVMFVVGSIFISHVQPNIRM